VPRFKVVQTSALEKGQIYLPMINLFLAIGTCCLVIAFQSSLNLTSAYGIAVNLYMIITTLLVARIAYIIWRWRWLKLMLFPIFLIFDSFYLLGNFTKFTQGGWIPLLIAFIGMIIMYTWNKGLERLRRVNFEESLSDRSLIAELNAKKIRRLPGTALFLTDPYDEFGGSLLHHLCANRILPKTIIFITFRIENKPYISVNRKFDIIQKAEGFYLLNIHSGFAENIHLPKLLEEMSKTIQLPFALDLQKITFFVEIIAIQITQNSKHLQKWQEFLFSFMLRNAVPDLQFYALPFNKTVAIGTYYRL
jgi:KUP system potassium uptake protein